jgi:phage-related protein
MHNGSVVAKHKMVGQLYGVRFQDAIYVLHIVLKKSRTDIALATPTMDAPRALCNFGSCEVR